MAMAKLCSELTGSTGLEVSATQVLAPSIALSAASSPCLTESVHNHSWFAVFTKSHHEKKAAEYFQQQQVDHFLPLYSEVHQWTNRRRVAVQLPLFPNYIFVRIGWPERGRVLRVPGVLSIVGTGSGATSLSDFEIESLRSGLPYRAFRPHPLLTVGSRVRIKVGALEGMEGIMVREKNNLRVVMTVALINQSVAVEVDACDIEPISRPTYLIHNAS